MKKKNIILATCLITISTMLPASGAVDQDGWFEPVGSEYETIKAQRIDFSEKTYVQGQITPAIYQLMTRISGVASSSYSIGDHVSKYDQIVVVDETESYLKSEACAIELERLYNKRVLEKDIYDAETNSFKKELETLNVKVANGSASTAERMRAELLDLELRKREDGHGLSLSDIEKQIAAKEAEYENLSKSLSKNIIYSPVEGQILYSSIKDGSEIKSWENGVIVLDETRRYIACQGNVKDMSEYDNVNVYIDGVAYPVSYVEKPGDGFSGSKLYFTVPEEASGYYSVLLEFESKKQEDALVIPMCTVYTNGQDKYVYRVKDGVREMVDVILGDNNGSLTVVTGGNLQEGDEIYVP